MKITAVETLVVKTDFDQAVRPSWSPGREWGSVSTTVFLVHTDEGITGIGAGTGSSEITKNIVAPRLVGQDPFRIDYLHRKILNSGAGGAAMAIASGIDVALWDLVGKAAGLPLYRLWGTDKTKVRAYASMVETSTPEQRAEDALSLIDKGYTAIKLRLHSSTIQEDIAQVEAVRKAVGDKMAIMVDANQAQEPGTSGAEDDLVWGYQRALATARELANYDVTWLEEPLGRFEFDQLERLSANTDVTIAGAENNIGLHEFRHIIDRHVYDLIQPDAMVLGGISQLRKVANYAEVRSIPVAPHHGGSGIGVAAHLQLAGAHANIGWVELLQDPRGMRVEQFQGLITEPLIPDKDGFVPLPDKPGLGIELVERAWAVKA